MVLDRARALGDRFLTPVAARMGGVNPNAISWAALLTAAAAGVGFYRGGPFLLSFAVALLLASAYLDALDGKVAKTFGKASPRGDFVDHVFDRYADVFLLAGVTFSAVCDVRIGALAIVGVLLTSYMGTQAQAVGQGRAYGGALGRADRLVLLFVGGLLQVLAAPYGGVVWGVPPVAFQPLEWVMVVFAVVGNLTAVQRAVAIWRGFSA